MEINNLETTGLSIGQVLKVTSGGGISSGIVLGASCYGEGYKEPEFLTYTVKRGDTLYKIASTYGVGVNDIIEFNQLPSTSLKR